MERVLGGLGGVCGEQGEVGDGFGLGAKAGVAGEHDGFACAGFAGGGGGIVGEGEAVGDVCVAVNV